jgi:hypothetical protein
MTTRADGNLDLEFTGMGSSTAAKLDFKAYGAIKPEYYAEIYERRFDRLRSKEINLLELGVHRGDSLRMWRDYFESGNVVGLDLGTSELDDPSGRIRLYQGKQQDLDLLDRIARESAPSGFDIIIDDCSHMAQLSLLSFWHLFTHHLKMGGIYVIEDWSLGYWQNWPDGHRPTRSSGRPSSTMRRQIWEALDRCLETRVMTRLAASRRRLKYLPFLALYKQRFPSHSYGMVGWVKQLVDEVGMEAMGYGGGMFESIEIFQGQVFVTKGRPGVDLLSRPG